VAESLWKTVLEKHPKLFWRSKAHFEANAWFFSHSAGSINSGDYTIFWTGFEDLALANECKVAALAKPSIMASSTPSTGARSFSTSVRSLMPL
jgi:acetylglutamate kinase